MSFFLHGITLLSLSGKNLRGISRILRASLDDRRFFIDMFDGIVGP
ncbi:MAG TPA: hypothetical protein PK749_06125 [Deltaproteobacteria bacterium]|nr:hypothetical protein [Deltaproteobacteria bacterium]HOY74718.1 hypothetical protein [Deltaproteobacteria bacterium]HPE44944.1 hypothetical protein [Deltaproteobacteria bacterium]HPH50382.1 hypothetical protein [Deltaproteobacteria bacterium]HRW80705.1 hypothetical protein [Desulfomonilia bacterium]